MAGRQRAVLVSDLHLCSNPRIDDFLWDAELQALLELPELDPRGEDRVDLVLLGDVFDLWQSVPEAECRARRSADIELAFDAASEVARIDAVLARHGQAFSALGAFARRPGCRLVVVPGNHDHVLVDPAVQAAVAARLGLAAGAPGLAFATSYESQPLSLYADHGCQYDANNAYGSFGSIRLRDEAAGYFFVKLFFNRVEYRDPRIENAPGGWGAVWHWLRRVLDLPLLASAIRWFGQYWHDGRVARRLALLPGTGPARAGAAAAALAMPLAPALLLGGPRGRSAERFFALDPGMEEFFRAAYQESAEVRRAVNELLEAQAPPSRGGRSRAGPARPAGRRRPAGKASSAPRPEVPPPHDRARALRPPVAAAPSGPLGPPADVVWAERLYGTGPAFRAPLDPAVTRFAVLGHTHGERSQPLGNGATYLNTGSWTGGGSRLPVVLAEEGASGPAARLLHLQGGKLG
jgi:UDP-2,3-diacylglucosamine pyrophosphatase LpxH